MNHSSSAQPQHGHQKKFQTLRLRVIQHKCPSNRATKRDRHYWPIFRPSFVQHIGQSHLKAFVSERLIVGYRRSRRRSLTPTKVCGSSLAVIACCGGSVQMTGLPLRTCRMLIQSSHLVLTLVPTHSTNPSFERQLVADCDLTASQAATILALCCRSY
jgi:hypothetical protein